MPGLFDWHEARNATFSVETNGCLRQAPVFRLPCSVNYRIIGCRRSQTLFIQSISSHKFPLPFSLLSAVCVVVLWSRWPSPCVFTFSSDLSSATSGEPNTNWTVTIHRPLFFHTAAKPALSSPRPRRSSEDGCPPDFSFSFSSCSHRALLHVLLYSHFIPHLTSFRFASQKHQHGSKNASWKMKKLQKTLQRGTNRQCLGGVLFIISVKVKFSLVP